MHDESPSRIPSTTTALNVLNLLNVLVVGGVAVMLALLTVSHGLQGVAA